MHGLRYEVYWAVGGFCIRALGITLVINTRTVSRLANMYMIYDVSFLSMLSLQANAEDFEAIVYIHSYLFRAYVMGSGELCRKESFHPCSLCAHKTRIF